MHLNNISVVGLGKLGQPLAVTLASRGFHILGIDKEQSVVESLSNYRVTVNETQLQELLVNYKDNIKFSTSYEQAVEETDVTFILVGTPSDRHGWFSNEFVEEALTEISKYLKESSKNYHLFVIASTVMPRSINEVFIPLIENKSGRKVNENFGICYCPELVALGSVVRDFLKPGMVILGESNNKSGNYVEEIYRKWVGDDINIIRMNIVNAELTKVCFNVFLTLKISFANHVSNLCEEIPGADVDAITQTLGKDYRISPYFLKGGMSFGGTCFPRDTKAFKALFEKYMNGSVLTDAIDEVNNLQDKLLLEKVLLHSKDKSIGILGLSFKPNTPVITESHSIKLVKGLIEHNRKVIVFDPKAIPNTKKVFKDRIIYANNVRELIQSADVFVVSTPWKEFYNLEKYFEGNKTIIDCWRIINLTALNSSVKYIPIGKNTNKI